MRYELKPITKSNWKAVVSLEVTPSQQNLIIPNAHSLVEATYDSEKKWTPLALYVDNKLVGFAMIGGENTAESSITFDRFMIDQHFQHQGYGHALFRAILNYLKDHYRKVETIYIPVHKDNLQAIPFYESFHFEQVKDGVDTVKMKGTITRE